MRDDEAEQRVQQHMAVAVIPGERQKSLIARKMPWQSAEKQAQRPKVRRHPDCAVSMRSERAANLKCRAQALGFEAA